MTPEHTYILTNASDDGRLLNHAISELNRAGITSKDDRSLSVHYGTSARMNDFIAERCSKVCPELLSCKRRLGMVIHTYLILSEAKERGFDSVAIFHDDISFLKDTRKLQEAIAEIPLDGDVVMVSWHPGYDSGYFRSGGHDTFKNTTKLKPWALASPDAAMQDGSGTVYSSKGVDAVLKLYDTAWFPNGKYKYADRLKPVDNWYAPSMLQSVNPSLRLYLSYPLLGVQSWIRPRQDKKTFNDHRFPRTYAQCCYNLHEDDYNVLREET